MVGGARRVDITTATARHRAQIGKLGSAFGRDLETPRRARRFVKGGLGFSGVFLHLERASYWWLRSAD